MGAATDDLAVRGCRARLLVEGWPPSHDRAALGLVALLLLALHQVPRADHRHELLPVDRPVRIPVRVLHHLLDLLVRRRCGTGAGTGVGLATRSPPRRATRRPDARRSPCPSLRSVRSFFSSLVASSPSLLISYLLYTASMNSMSSFVSALFFAASCLRLLAGTREPTSILSCEREQGNGGLVNRQCGNSWRGHPGLQPHATAFSSCSHKTWGAPAAREGAAGTCDMHRPVWKASRAYSEPNYPPPLPRLISIRRGVSGRHQTRGNRAVVSPHAGSFCRAAMPVTGPYPRCRTRTDIRIEQI